MAGISWTDRSYLEKPLNQITEYDFEMMKLVIQNADAEKKRLIRENERIYMEMLRTSRCNALIKTSDGFEFRTVLEDVEFGRDLVRRIPPYIVNFSRDAVAGPTPDCLCRRYEFVGFVGTVGGGRLAEYREVPSR